MRQECQPQQFSCELTFRPVRMFLLDTRFGKRTREQAHFQGQEEPLFFGHCSLNLKLDGLRLRARIGDGHEQNVNTESCRSSSGDRSYDQQRFLPRRDRLGQRSIRRFMRQIFLAGEESQKRPPHLCDLIPNRPAQHGITGLQRVEHRRQSDRSYDFEMHFAPCVCQRAKMLREYDPDHGSVCTSTESTPGKSRTIGAQLSPASAEA